MEQHAARKRRWRLHRRVIRANLREKAPPLLFLLLVPALVVSLWKMLSQFPVDMGWMVAGGGVLVAMSAVLLILRARHRSPTPPASAP